MLSGIYICDMNVAHFECHRCKKDSTKPISEYNRNKKINRKNYCSRQCANADLVKNIDTTKIVNRICKECGSHFLTKIRYTICDSCRPFIRKKKCPYCENMINCNSNKCTKCRNISKIGTGDGFKEFIRRIRARQTKKNKTSDLNIQYLKELWATQQGKCAYTGIKLRLPDYKKNSNSSIFTASLDRIDSNIWYMKSNVQFVSMAINYMKHSMTHEDTLNLIEMIRENIS